MTRVFCESTFFRERHRAGGEGHQAWRKGHVAVDELPGIGKPGMGSGG